MTQLEKIQLKLNESKKVKVEFALKNELEEFINKGNELMTDYNDLQKQSEIKSNMASNAAKQAISLAEKAISQAKELGVDTSFFNGRLQMAKDLSARSSKAKANIL